MGSGGLSAESAERPECGLNTPDVRKIGDGPMDRAEDSLV